jgi:predicted GNAT family acetyltransferase
MSFGHYSYLLYFSPMLCWRLLRSALPNGGKIQLATMATNGSTLSSPSPAVQHAEEAGQFFLDIGKGERAVLRYRPLPTSDGLDLYSTTVPPAHEGKGLAKILAVAAFEHCAENNLKMKLTCWYLDGYLRRHPDERFNSLVVS